MIYYIDIKRFKYKSILSVKSGKVIFELDGKYVVRNKEDIIVDKIFTDYNEALNYESKLQKELDKQSEDLLNSQVKYIIDKLDINDLPGSIKKLIENDIIKMS